MAHRASRTTTLALAGALALSPVGLAACGDDTAGPEQGVSVGDVQEDDGALDGADAGTAVGDGYDGPYDSDLYGEIDSYDGQTVTVSAEVGEVVNGDSFTIAGTDSTSVDPLLVVGAEGTDTSTLEPGATVQVTGTVHESFSTLTAEETLGVDLDEGLFSGYESQPYIAADSVSTSVPTETQ